jgi:ABC-type spermidine/putrescine transport system permease subunit II
MRWSVRLGRWALFCYAAAVLVFLLFPLVVVVPESFSPSAVLHFPPRGASLQWYRDFFTGPFWVQSTWLSIRLAFTVAALATALGLGAAVALNRYVRRGKTMIRVLVLSPLIIPVIVTAIALFDVMTYLRLEGTFLALVIAHTVLALPFPIIILENRLRSIDPSLEEAAMSMGASRLKAFCKVTLPLIVPSVVSAALFAFLASWDEVVVVLFVGGATLQTLPVLMFQFLETEVRPTVAAASTMLIVLIAVVFVGAQISSRVRRSRMARSADPQWESPSRGASELVASSVSGTTQSWP